MANNLGIREGGMVIIESPEGAKIKVKAKLTKRVDEKTIFMPFHFAGTLMGESYDQRLSRWTCTVYCR